MSDANASNVLRDLLLAAGTALIGAVGSLSFVALVGGAVTMARLRGAGLPTEEGVSVQPRSVLLAVGGETLAAAIAVSALVVLIIHLLPSHRAWWFFVPPRWPGRRPVRATTRSSGALRGNRRAVLAALLALGIVVASVFAPWHDSTAPGLIGCETIAVALVVFAYHDWRKRSGRWRPWVLALVSAYAGWLYYLFWANWTLDFGAPLAVAAGIGVLTLGTAWLVVRLGGRALAARDVSGRRITAAELRGLLGVAGVLMLYATMAVVAASLINPLVRPAAAVLTSSRGLCGVFVAEDADHVFIDVPTQNPRDLDRGLHDRGEMLELKRDEVTQLAIGSSQPLPAAATRAYAMLLEFLQDREPPLLRHRRCSWTISG